MQEKIIALTVKSGCVLKDAQRPVPGFEVGVLGGIMKNGGRLKTGEHYTQGTILIYSSPFTKGLFCTEHLIRLDCGQWMSHALF